jgi:hypothetical protein
MFVFLKEVLTDGCTIVYRSWDACDDPIPKLIEFHSLISQTADALRLANSNKRRHLQFEDDGIFNFSIKAKWNFVFGLIICSI